MPSDTRHRRSLRLLGYDYSQPGAYFLTICTLNRRSWFGKVVDRKMVLNHAGRMVQAVWKGLPERFHSVALDAFVVMPNHFHGIIVLVGAQFIAPNACDRNKRWHSATSHQGAINRAPTLGEIVRVFKAATTRQIRLAGLREFGWQRNYYEHIIRGENSLNRIREYIATNPLRWELDRENPQRRGEDEFDRWLAMFKALPDRTL